MGKAMLPVGAVASVIGTSMQSVSAIQAGNAARQIGNYQAAILRNNATLSDRAEDDALVRGTISIARNRTETYQAVGRQRALLAGSGILVDDGTAANLVADTHLVGRQQELDIQMNAEREALSWRIQAMNQRADADLAAFAGVQQQRSSRLSAASTLLGGAGRLAMIGAR